MDFTSPAELDRLCPDWRQRAAYACGPEGFLDDAEALWAAEAASRGIPAGRARRHLEHRTLQHQPRRR